jgi:hypothetical protein
MSRRILTIGSTSFLRKKFGGAYHVHIVLKSAPDSSQSEVVAVDNWLKGAFPGAVIEPYGNHQGQLKFEVPVKADAVKHSLHADEAAPYDTIAAVDLTQTVSQKTSDQAPRRKRNVLVDLFILLERHKEELKFAHYSVEPTTLNDVFFNVIKQNNVREEGCEGP